MERVISNLRSNHISGTTLMKFSDEEWRDCISSMGKISLLIWTESTYPRGIQKSDKG